MRLYNKKKGISILGILLLGVVAIFVLSYFKVDIKGVVESPTAQNNVNYVTQGGETLWQKYLEKPASYIWNNIVVGLLWQAFVNNLERVKNGQPTEIQQDAPALPR